MLKEDTSINLLLPEHAENEYVESIRTKEALYKELVRLSSPLDRFQQEIDKRVKVNEMHSRLAVRYIDETAEKLESLEAAAKALHQRYELKKHELSPVLKEIAALSQRLTPILEYYMRVSEQSVKQ